MTTSPRGLRLGLGPVFRYERIAASRRWQGYALRALFAAVLLAALFVIWSRDRSLQSATLIRAQANLGVNFFLGVIGTQLTLVLLAAPAATAGAICLDRASGTMTHLLVTDLSDVEIVLGKLAARLVPVLGLVGCAVPIMAILTLLGGVDPNALFGAFLVTVGCAVLGCALALLFSLAARSTHEALLGTYAVWGLWLTGGPFTRLVNGAFGWSLSVPAVIADPYQLAFLPYTAPGTVTMGDYVGFLAVSTGLAAVLTAVAVLRLRAVCTRTTVPRKRSLRARLERVSRRFDPSRYLPGPSLDFNPVFWREWHRARPTRWARVVAILFVAGSAAASLSAVILPASTFAMAWVNGLQVAIGMLLLSVTAATSLAEERVRGSLDVLMTTMLSTREIVVGKWLGTFRLVPWLAVLPVLVILGSDPRKLYYVPTAVLTLVFVLVCGAAITSLGLALATWCSRVGRAVALTVTAYVLVTVGWLFVAMWFQRGPGDEGVMMASSFFFAGELAADLCGNGPMGRHHLGWAVFWTLMYALAALGLFGATLLTFNRCLGRVEGGLVGVPRRRPRAARIARTAGETV